MPGSGNFLSNKQTWALFALLLCIFAGAILGDSATESLLLSHCDTRILPTMFMVNALLLFFTSAFLMSTIDRIDRGTFFIVLVVTHFIVVTAARCALLLGASFLYPLLFSYAYVSKIVLFLLFWTIANDLTDSRRATVVFPFIAAGGTLGAIGASFAIPLLLRVISADNLLLIWSALIMILVSLFLVTRGSFGKELRPSPAREKHASKGVINLGGDFALVRQEPLLRNIAILYFLLFFILINQHYTFYAQMKMHLVSAKAMASFLGFFNGFSMFTTLLLQVTVAGRVLTKMGSTRSMLFLPGILCIVFICLTCIGLIPGLTNGGAKSDVNFIIFWSVVLGMGLRASFFDAFFSPNFQVFFSGLAKDIRGRGKLFIEGAVKPLSIIAASLWLFFVMPRLSFGCSMFFLFFASAIMIIQTMRIRKKYTESLTRSLTGIRSKQLVQFFNFVDLAKEENFLTALSRALEKEDYEIKKYVAGILADMNSKESIAVLTEHLEGSDDMTRALIISALTPLKKNDLIATYSRYLTSSDRRVVANCILALAELQNVDINEGLEIFLHHSDNRIRANTIMVLWPLWPDAKRKHLMTLLTEMLFSSNEYYCASALYAIGTLRAKELLPLVARLAAPTPSHIVGNSMLWNNYCRALSGIGGEQPLDMLLDLGHVTGKKANELVAAVGRLLDGEYPLGHFIEKLTIVDYRRRRIMLAALQDRHQPIRQEYETMLKQLAQKEVKEIYRDWTSLTLLDTKASLPGVRLLRTAVFEERIDERLRNVVAVSSLLDPSGQVGLVAHRLHHTNRHVRARALEVLDNVGDVKINRWILKLLDTNDPAIHVKEAATAFQIGSKTLGEALSAYAFDPCEWIRQCAVYAAANLYSASNDTRWLDIAVRAEEGFRKGKTDGQWN